MASNNNKDDWLPPGWKVQIKSSDSRKFKCYVHLATRQKFYSKPAVLLFINDGSFSNDNSHSYQELDNKSPVEQRMQLVEANPSAEWLPTGWTVELKTRLSGVKKGTTYKVFCDPSSGSKFYSKPEVFRYLKSSAASSGQKEGGSSRKSSRIGIRSVDWLEVQKTNPESSDWQISETGNRKSAFSGQEEVLAKKTFHEDLQLGFSKVTRKKMRGNPAVRTDLSSDDPLDAQNTVLESSDLLEAMHTNSESSDWQISETHNHRSVSSRQKKVIVERTVDKDLPLGWIKETRKKKRGNGVVRTDPFYLDPASGLVFRSKLEVLRYLETGEISRHTYQRRNGSSNREEISIEKTSPLSVARKTTTQCQTGKQLFTGEEVPHESLSLVPEVKSIKDTGVRRSNRSALSVRSASAGEAGLKQSTFLLEPDKIKQEIPPSKRMIKKCSAPDEAVSMTGFLPKIQDADEAEKSTIPLEIELPASTSSSIVMVENEASVAMQGCSNRKAQTKYFKESGLRRSTRSSLGLRSISVGEAGLKQSANLLEPDRITQEMEPSKRLLRKCSAPDEAEISRKILVADEEEKDTIPKETKLPISCSTAIVMVENPVSVAMQGCSNEKAQTSKRKTEDRKLPSVPSRCSKRLAGVDAQVVFHRIPVERALRASSKSIGTKSVSSLFSLHNDLQEKPGLPNADTLDVLTCQEAKHHMLDIDIQSVLATQGQPGNNSDSLVLGDPDVVDLQEQTPPGFSVNLSDEVPSKSIAQLSKDPRVTVPDSLKQKDPRGVDLQEQTSSGFSGYLTDEVSKTMVQSAEDPRDSVPVTEMDIIPSDDPSDPTAQGQSNSYLGRKVEKPAADFPVTEEQPGSITKAAEQSTSDLSFPAPLWSDPCLEFAYKTLTGAIPLDDSLAIKDYIQHQLHTSHSNGIQSLPDIDVPNFFQNDETKVVPPLPGVTVPNFYGFGSHKTNR